MFHLEILIIVVAVIICGCNTLIIMGLRRCDDSGGGRLLSPATNARQRRQQFFLFHTLAIALAVSGARPPSNLTHPPFGAAISFYVQATADHRFLGTGGMRRGGHRRRYRGRGGERRQVGSSRRRTGHESTRALAHCKPLNF